MAAITRKLPLKRKLEEALAGYLIDAQTRLGILKGLPIICGHTGRSPDDSAAALDDGEQPELPVLVVYCGKSKESTDLPPGCGIRDCEVVFHHKTHSGDEARAEADVRLAEVEDLLEDRDAIIAALNQPDAADVPDPRRVKELYFYAIEEAEDADAHDEEQWDDQIIRKVIAQAYDPDRA